MPDRINFMNVNISEFIDTTDEGIRDIVKRVQITSYERFVQYFYVFTAQDIIKAKQTFFENKETYLKFPENIEKAKQDLNSTKEMYDLLMKKLIEQDSIRDSHGNVILQANNAQPAQPAQPGQQPAQQIIPLNKDGYIALMNQVQKVGQLVGDAAKKVSDLEKQRDTVKENMQNAWNEFKEYLVPDPKVAQAMAVNGKVPTDEEVKNWYGQSFDNLLTLSKDSGLDIAKIFNDKAPKTAAGKKTLGWSFINYLEGKLDKDDPESEYGDLYKDLPIYKYPVRVDGRLNKEEKKKADEMAEKVAEDISTQPNAEYGKEVESRFGEDANRDKSDNDNLGYGDDEDEDEDEYYDDEYEDEDENQVGQKEGELKLSARETASINTIMENKTPAELLWFNLIYGAKKIALSSVQADFFEEKGLEIRDFGLPDDLSSKRNERAVKDSAFDVLIDSFNLKDTQSAADAMRLLIDMEYKLKLECGKEIEHIEKSLLSDADFRHEKALFIFTEGQSIPKLLGSSFYRDYEKFEKQFKGTIAETISITPETTMDELASIMGLSVEEKAAFFKENNYAKKDTPIYRVFDAASCVEIAKAEYANHIFAKLEKDIRKETENKYRNDPANIKYLKDADIATEYIKSDSSYRGDFIPDEWRHETGERIVKKSTTPSAIHAYQVFDKLTTSGSSILPDKEKTPEGLFDKPIAQEELRVEVPDIEVVPNIKVPDIEVVPDNVVPIEQQPANPAPQQPANPAPQLEEYPNVVEWFDVLVPDDTGKFSSHNISEDVYNDLRDRMGLYSAEPCNEKIAQIGSTLVISSAQKKAKVSLGLKTDSNATLVGHYMLWLLATKQEANIDNVLTIAENPDNKKEYQDFLVQNAIKASDNDHEKQELWCSIYMKAHGKAMSYIMPDIDYSDPKSVNKHIEELNVLRTITESAVKIADHGLGQGGYDVINNQIIAEGAKEAQNFWKKMEFATRPLKEAYLSSPTDIYYKDLNRDLRNIAKNRYLTGKRMNEVRALSLSAVAYNMPDSEKRLFNDFVNEDFKGVTEELFTIKDSVLYLGGKAKPKFIQEADKAYETLVTKGYEKSFRNVLYNNFIDFRSKLNENPEVRWQIEKMGLKLLAAGDTAADMKKLLSDKKSRFSSWVNKKFERLLTPEVLEILKKNNIDELDIFLIDGKKPSELWDKKYNLDKKDAGLKNKLYKLEILKAIFKGDSKIEINSYALDKNEVLKPAGTFTLTTSKTEAEEMVTGYYYHYNFNEGVIKKLEAYKKSLINALPAIEGETRRDREERFLTDGSSLYTEMAESLEDAIKSLKDEKTSPEAVRKALNRLNDAANEYYSSRKGVFFGPRSDYGKERLKVSDGLRKDIPGILITFDDIRRKLNIDYTISNSDKSMRQASYYDVDNELNRINVRFREIYNLKADKRNEEFSARYKVLAEKNDALAELINLLKENVPSVEIDLDYRKEGILNIVKDKSGLSPYEYAINYITRKMVEEAMKDDSTADDVKNMTYLVKSGKLKEGAFALTRYDGFSNIIALSPQDYYKVKGAENHVDVLKEISTYHQLNKTKIEEAEKLRANQSKLYDDKMNNIKKYNVGSGEYKAGFYVANYYSTVKPLTQQQEREYRGMVNLATLGDVGGYSLARNGGISIAVLALAAEVDKKGNPKYSADELMDPNRIIRAKAEKFKEIVKLMKAVGDASKPEAAKEANKKLAGYIYNGEKALRKMCDDLAAKIDFNSDNYDSTKEFATLLGLTEIRNDARQEMEHCKTEIMELAKKDNPSINTFEGYNEYVGKTLSPISNMINRYELLDNSIKKLESGQGIEKENLYTNMIIIQNNKTLMRDWDKKKPLSQWSVESGSTMKGREVITAAGNSVDVANVLSDDFYKYYKDDIKNGLLFKGVRYIDDNDARPDKGFKHFPNLNRMEEDIQYKKQGKAEYREKEEKVIQKHIKKQEGASRDRKRYIKKSIDAVKKLSEQLKYGYIPVEKNWKSQDASIRDIISEKWCEYFEKAGFKGKTLDLATKNATEYLMVHNKELRNITPAVLDKILYTDFVDDMVKNSPNGLFMGKAAVAINHLISKDYGNNTDDLVRDAAYAHTAQIIRINGRIPKNVNDYNLDITADSYLKTMMKSDTFKNSLKAGNPPAYIKPKEIVNKFMNDKEADLVIINQEKVARDAHLQRGREENLRRQQRANRRNANNHQAHNPGQAGPNNS